MFTYFVVYFLPFALSYSKWMTTLTAKQLVHDPQKVQGTIITDDMLGFLINFVGIVPNVNHFIIVLVMFHVYLVREGHPLSKQIVQANMRNCKDCWKTRIGWHHKMVRRQQHKSSRSWHSIRADTGIACNPEDKKQWAFSCTGKNNRFPCLDITKFPGGDLSHSSKFGIFVGIL